MSETFQSVVRGSYGRDRQRFGKRNLRYPDVQGKLEARLRELKVEGKTAVGVQQLFESAYTKQEQQARMNADGLEEKIEGKTAAERIKNGEFVLIDFGPVVGLVFNGEIEGMIAIANLIKGRPAEQPIALAAELQKFADFFDIRAFPEDIAKPILLFQEKYKQRALLAMSPDQKKLKDFFSPEEARAVGEAYTKLLQLSGIHFRARGNPGLLNDKQANRGFVSPKDQVQVIGMAESRVSSLLRQLSARGISVVAATSANLHGVREPFWPKDVEALQAVYRQKVAAGEFDGFGLELPPEIYCYKLGSQTVKHEKLSNASYASGLLPDPKADNIGKTDDATAEVIRVGNQDPRLTKAILDQAGLKTRIPDDLNSGEARFVNLNENEAKALAQISQRQRLMALVLYQNLKDLLKETITDDKVVKQIAIALIGCCYPIHKVA